MGELICARCGSLAKGYAFIGDDRYCHPDCASEGPDCYSLQSANEALTGPALIQAMGKAADLILWAQRFYLHLPQDERTALWTQPRAEPKRPKEDA